jgi:hypothetical protein
VIPEGIASRPRILRVQGAAGVIGPLALDAPDIEVVVESGPTRALERLETDGDFAVAVCDENVGGTSGLALLATVRALSPTTVRVLVSESLARAPSVVPEHLFRCISPHSSAVEVHRVLAEALDYHQLLATCPAQPVEGKRPVRDAILPPAKPDARPPRMPVWQGFVDVAAASNPALIDAPPEDEVLIVEPATTRVGLRVVGRIVELLPGATVVGRSRTCHIPIPDPQISRRHAAFANTGTEISVRNLSQTNGVRVNGVLIDREAPHPLIVGDRVTLGSHEIEVCGLGDYCPSFEPTHSVSLHADASEAETLSTLVTLARVAEKYFVLGQGREAERVLRPLLEGLLRHCEAGRAPGEGDVQMAAALTLRIAEVNRAGEWIDYVFQLFNALERPLPADVLEYLYRIIPESQGVKMGGFRAYVDTLARVQERFGPKERFLLRRIQGLETPLKMSAHV